jgi:hypothetical protein
MTVTIRINNTGKKADSLINMLKNLAEDYDFIEFYDDIEKLPELDASGFQNRYKYALENAGEGLTISEMENKLYPGEKI